MGVLHILEHFDKVSAACATLAELAVALGDAGAEIGFDYFALTLCDNLRQTAPRFAHLANYPPAYAEVFVAGGYYRFDPILHAAQRRIGGFAWDQVATIITVDQHQSNLLTSAAREGLRAGYTIPTNVPGEPCGAVSFASKRVRRLTQERRWCADCIGRTAFEASRRLRGLSSPHTPVPHLALREIQCLHRLASGDMDKEIARALGISPETVNQYVKSARRSYAARTRAHLIALALKDSQITFDPFPDFGE